MLSRRLRKSVSRGLRHALRRKRRGIGRGRIGKWNTSVWHASICGGGAETQLHMSTPDPGLRPSRGHASAPVLSQLRGLLGFWSHAGRMSVACCVAPGYRRPTPWLLKDQAGLSDNR